MELSTDIIILLKSPSIGEAVTPIRVSAIPPAILQLAPGSDVRAEVLGKMLNGRTLMRVAGELLTMELPDTVKSGSSLRMTFLGREPRPTFSLSLQQNSSMPVAISQTGRWLGQIAQGSAGTSGPEQLGRLTRLMDGPPLDTARLAASLREALSTSGLFYESHLAEWAAGKRELGSIMQEPQATLSRQAGPSPDAIPTAGDRAPGTLPPAADGTQTTARVSSAAVNPAAEPAGAESLPPDMPTATTVTDTRGTIGAGEARQSQAAPTTQPGPGTAPPPAGQAAEATPGGSPLPAPGTASAEPESIRAGTTASQAPATPSGIPGETPAGPDTPPRPAQQAEALPPGTTAPRPADASSTAPTIAGPPAPGQPPASPASVVSGSQPPPESPPSREQLPPGTSPPSDAEGTTAASRQQREPSLQAGRSQSLPQQEPAGEESVAPLARPQAEHDVQDAAPGRQAQRPEVADPRTASVIREQLAALNSGMVTWKGEAWQGQPLQWQVEDREARHQDSSEGRWHSELRVDLPNLGRIVTSLKVRGKDLHISFTADADTTTGLMQQEALHLEERLAAAGLNLANLVIRHGKKE